VERACPDIPDFGGISEWEGRRLIDNARELAGLVRTGRYCPVRPALAFAIARRVAGLRRSESLEAHGLLAELYEQGVGVAANPARALEERRRAWLLSPAGFADPPFPDGASRDLYLTRPATIAFLRPYAASANPQHHHVRALLAQALYAQGSHNRAAALALLQGGSNANAAVLRARIDFEGDDPTARAAALTALRRLAMFSEAKADARGVLRAYARRQLAANPSPEQREEAIELLGIVAWEQGHAAVAELMAAVREANGGRAPANASDEAARALRRRLAPSLSDDDYPAAGMRAGEQGTVRLRALIGPSGRILLTEPVIVGPDQPRTLVAMVRRVYLTRPLRPVDLGPDQPTPYMWIALPDVHFRLDE